MSKKVTLNKDKAQPFKGAVKEYDNLINWAEVFPRSGRPDLRKKPTRHQKRVLTKLNAILRENGGAGRFHKVRKSKKLEITQAATGTEKFFKGYFAPGEMRITGDWAVLNIESAGVDLYYKGFPHNPLTAEQAAEFTREALKLRPHTNLLSVGLSSKGGQFDMVGIDEDYELINKARETYSKYAQMADNGEKRDNYHGQPAAHPRDWLTGITFTRKL